MISFVYLFIKNTSLFLFTIVFILILNFVNCQALTILISIVRQRLVGEIIKLYLELYQINVILIR